MIKALVRTGHDARPLAVTLVTRSALATYDTEPTAPAHAGLHGLFGSLGQEYTNWSVRRTDLDTADPAEDLAGTSGPRGERHPGAPRPASGWSGAGCRSSPAPNKGTRTGKAVSTS